MWSLLSRAGAVIVACLAVVLLGTSAWAAAPTPAPLPPAGAGVIAWWCQPGSTPSPTTSPSPAPLGSTPMPTVVASPYGQECAATSYAAEPGPVSVQVSTAPVSVQGWPECPAPSSSPSPSATPSSAPPSSALVPGSVLGRDCSSLAELDRGQAFGLWLFLGSLLLLGVFAVVVRYGRAFRG